MNNVRIMADSGRCTGCGICVQACPHGYIELSQGRLGFPMPHMEKCDGCGQCLRKCPFSDEYEEE